MNYSNPDIPEEINYSKENSLKEFFVLLLGIFIVVSAVVLLAHLLAQTFAHYIPFSYEKKLIPALLVDELSQDVVDTETAKRTQEYLQDLSLQLAETMDLPEGMTIKVSATESGDINAFATLNGLIFINQGLLDYVDSENELAFILAHEIAHIKQRHPIKALSSGIVLGLAFSMISGSIENDASSAAIVTGATLTSHGFSRAQEQEADNLALKAVNQHYGHIDGSQDFFARLQNSPQVPELLRFLGTHPGMQERIDNVQRLAAQLNLAVSGKVTPAFLASDN